MKILVTGGRNYKDYDRLVRELDAVSKDRATHIIHGGASGADLLARQYAIAAANDIQEVVCPANWMMQGRAAGPIRNQKMIDLKPDVVVAFPGGKGTADCVRRAKAAGIPVIEVTP